MDIPFFRPAITADEIEAVAAVLRSGWLTTGPKTREFEESFVAFLGGGVDAVAVNSATAGLHLAAEACGIGPGDSVIVPTLTFTATAEVIRYLGAEVVLVDVEPGTYLIDLADAKRRLTPHCKAIMPVHFGGLPCDMKAVLNFARDNGLKVIEDSAHALPARRDGRLIGAWDSDACIFSFYANKTITTGEGGMLVTRNPEIAARATLMRTHGLNREAFDRFSKVGAAWIYDVVAPGFKYNLTDIASALGITQLSKVYSLQKQRQQAALRYFEALKDLPLDLPALPPEGDLHAWHLFPIRIHEDACARRDEVIAALTKAGIGSSVHYRPLHEMTYWKQRYPCQPGEFAVADRYFAGAVSLPLFPGMTDTQVERVGLVLRRLLGR
ncbi:MAG TPA: DegT/DnrJ/EryC1/StrS family aminotransferase [Methylocella sp.]|nr:DegT/DnrJ/EryC1/StrS family aminotransferase [Methylocella sp.]